MSDDLQARMKQILDDHFQPMLKDEWKDSFSIFEIGARGEDGIDEVVVWARTANIIDHTSGLMVPNEPMMLIDPIERGGGNGDPRLRSDTVLIRLFKPIETEVDGEVDLMVELFQIFGDEDDAEATYDNLVAMANRKVAEG